MLERARTFFWLVFLIFSAPLLAVVSLFLVVLLAIGTLWVGLNFYAFLFANPTYANRALSDYLVYGEVIASHQSQTFFDDDHFGCVFAAIQLNDSAPLTPPSQLGLLERKRSEIHTRRENPFFWKNGCLRMVDYHHPLNLMDCIVNKSDSYFYGPSEFGAYVYSKTCHVVAVFDVHK